METSLSFSRISRNEHDGLLQGLASSELFLRYRDAFGLTTGRTLSLCHPDKEKSMAERTLPCAKKLRQPVQVCGRDLAVLEMDAVRLSNGPGSSFEEVASALLDDGCSASDLHLAQAAFLKMPVLSPECYEALQTMLKLFAEQLEDFTEKLFLQTHDTDPTSVRRARQYILQNLHSPLTLEEVASEAGVSPFHFCKVFKRATHMTFTDFVNRARVEEAKRLLLKPQARITEVAFDVGFQSLSQFNRSFRRVTNLSPTEFRSHQRPTRMALA
jgi:AraC-like DNA-binding protein